MPKKFYVVTLVRVQKHIVCVEADTAREAKKEARGIGRVIDWSLDEPIDRNNFQVLSVMRAKRTE